MWSRGNECGTAYCRAGWAVVLAGEKGMALKEKLGWGAAGALIYAKSRPHMPVPNFYGRNEVVLQSIKEDAAAAKNTPQEREHGE